MKRATLVAPVVALAALGLAGCSSTPDPASTPPAATQSVAGSATDVAFAQSMIPHHQQAVEMADIALAPDSGASPEVIALAEQIKGAQDPEIAQMTGWLQEWGAPTSMPGATDGMAGMDHSGHDMGAMTMSGMMTQEQMDQLMSASGTDFDAMWSQMMIEHHQGAIAMAEQVKANSANPEVTQMADQIIAAQQAEIATMQQMLTD